MSERLFFSPRNNIKTFLSVQASKENDNILPTKKLIKKKNGLFKLSFFLKLMRAYGGNESYRIDTGYDTSH